MKIFTAASLGCSGALLWLLSTGPDASTLAYSADHRAIATRYLLGIVAASLGLVAACMERDQPLPLCLAARSSLVLGILALMAWGGAHSHSMIL